MATAHSTADDKSEPTTDHDVPGSFFGIDGAGWVHYFDMAQQLVTVVDGDERKSFSVPEDKDLIDWGLEMLDEHEAYWEEIRVDPPKRQWLEGELPVGEEVDR